MTAPDIRGVQVEIAPSDWRAQALRYRWRGPKTLTWGKSHTVGWYMTCLALVLATWPVLFTLARVLMGSWWWGFILVIPTPLPIRKVAERFSRHVDRSRTLIHHGATFLAEVGGKRPEQPQAVEYALDRDSLEFP